MHNLRDLAQFRLEHILTTGQIINNALRFAVCAQKAPVCGGLPCPGLAHRGTQAAAGYAGLAPPALCIRFMRRLFRRAALFLWMMPFSAARSSWRMRLAHLGL